MNIDRYMVTLFFEIKRNLPSGLQTDLKISDPQIGERMLQVYRDSDDENIRLLTEIFLERAGDDWKKKLKKVDKVLKSQAKSKSSDTLPLIKQLSQKTKVKPKRIYRGQLVSD